MAKLTAVSGVGAKGPACFLVETERARLLLDLGYGPAPDQWPDVSKVGRVDALLLSHGHRDHAGALKLAHQVGNPPLYATASVLAAVRYEAKGSSLPLNGATEVCGIKVRTGRNGHAPGGVWLDLEVGDGLVYMGDHGLESPLYAFDTPPRAGTLVLDGSYGSYADSLDDCIARLDPVFARGAALFPVPVNGRGPEMAYHLAHTRGILPYLGDDLRASLLQMSAEDSASLRSGVAAELARIAREAPPIAAARGMMLAGPGDAAGGVAGELITRWEHEPQPEIVFTGYLAPGTPAQRLTDSRRARYVRWNVHPRLTDNAALVRAVKAHTVIPAFGEARHLDAWRAAFAPARVTLEREIIL
jgi:Cft2 family RNA processing exonuclease